MVVGLGVVVLVVVVLVVVVLVFVCANVFTANKAIIIVAKMVILFIIGICMLY